MGRANATLGRVFCAMGKAVGRRLFLTHGFLVQGFTALHQEQSTAFSLEALHLFPGWLPLVPPQFLLGPSTQCKLVLCPVGRSSDFPPTLISLEQGHHLPVLWHRCLADHAPGPATQLMSPGGSAVQFLGRQYTGLCRGQGVFIR